MKKSLVLLVLLGMVGACSEAKADVFQVFGAIGAASSAVSAVTGATRDTLSTYEYSQRVLDRRQDRLDLKRSQKSYSDDAESEYYRTLQETQNLQKKMNNNNL